MTLLKLEEKFGISIPDDFKLFLKLIEENNPLIEYFSPLENFSFRLTKWLLYEANDIRVDDFFNIPNLENHWTRQIEIWGSLDYLPFGSLTIPYSGVLLYKIADGEVGRIYYTEAGSRKPLYLAADLFSFFDSLKVEYKESGESLLPRLYKNWGEAFWRIRDEKETT